MPTVPEIIYTQARLPSIVSPVNSVAVTSGRIVAVGAESDVIALAGPSTRRVSLNGAVLLPGFHDAHCHVLGFGLTLAMVSLTNVPTIPELVQRLQTRADAQNADMGDWVRGRGYTQNVLAEGRHPTRHDLDTIGGGKPYVLITHASGHAVSVNSRVLALAQITRESPDPPGGTIVRDAHGQPTGVLLETATNLAYRVVPEPSRTDKLAALERASNALNALGITSAVDATLGVAARDSQAEISVYEQAAFDGTLTVRCSLMMLLTQLVNGESVPLPEELMTPSDFVRLGPAKVFTDGALTTRTAFLRSPFAASDSLGTAVWSADELNTMVGRAHEAGWQIAAHAIGDAAIDLCLDAYGKALAKHPRPDSRHRIEHAMLLWPDQIGRVARLGVLPIYQPEFLMRFGDAYLSALGTSRAHRLMPYADTLAANLPLVFSSDIPVIPGSPLDGMASAVNRRTPSGEVLGPHQCVSAADALRAYTEGAAYSVFLENDRGKITPGHRADFAVLNADPLTLSPDKWADEGADGLAVTATIVGGKIVYGDV